jgi:DNA excision repair protein ERCC-4
MDNDPENPDQPNGTFNSRQRGSTSEAPEEFGEDEAALRDSGQMDEDDDVMEMIATQSQPAARKETPTEEPVDEEMREIMDLQDGTSPPPEAVPPVFRPVHFDLAGNLAKSVERRMRKNHEPVLEELPKWSLLAKVLKEIEDTMARIKDTHAGMFQLTGQ